MLIDRKKVLQKIYVDDLYPGFIEIVADNHIILRSLIFEIFKSIPLLYTLPDLSYHINLEWVILQV